MLHVFEFPYLFRYLVQPLVCTDQQPDAAPFAAEARQPEYASHMIGATGEKTAHEDDSHAKEEALNGPEAGGKSAVVLHGGIELQASH